MEMTVSCKMTPSGEDARLLLRTTQAFAQASTYAAQVALRRGIRNKVKLQHAVYREIRDRFGLSANLAIRAIRRASGALANKKAKPPKLFRPTSISYDARTFTYQEKEDRVSLTTLGERIRVPLVLGKRQRECLRGQKPSSATVFRRNGTWFVNIVVWVEEEQKKSGPPLGVDLGLRNTATTSSGKQISGTRIQARKAEYARIRASLQSKGTRGAKRLLKRLSGRERRMVAWWNHTVSRALVEEAKRLGRGILRFECLKDIRERTRCWNKHRNRMISGWSFGELQGFSTYKALRAGLAVESVDPAWTSATHSACGKRGFRSILKHWLYCPPCDRVEDADRNAASNIEAGGVRAGEIPAVRNGTRMDDVPGGFSSSHGSVQNPAL